MSAQRERLLAALAESDAYDEAHYDWSDETPYPQRLFDLLLARGVRVVDTDTLARAMAAAAKTVTIEVTDFYVRFAADVLAALDGAE